MNLNRKLKKFSGDGIPAYNARINELVDAANWLLGIRTINGRAIAESDQGPILDLSQANMTQPGSGNNPWATDPDGNPAGWKKITGIDLDGSITGYTNSMFKLWTWVGIPQNISSEPIPWMVDPNNNTAQWVQHDVCVGGQVVTKWFWGTP